VKKADDQLRARFTGIGVVLGIVGLIAFTITDFALYPPVPGAQGPEPPGTTYYAALSSPAPPGIFWIAWAAATFGPAIAGALTDVSCAAGGALVSARWQTRPAPGHRGFQTPLPSRWQLALRVAARFMPPDERKCWLEEADSVLFDLCARQRLEVTRNYLLTAPRVVVIAWSRKLSRQTR